MKILHLEDSPRDAELVAEILAVEFPGCDIAPVSSEIDFRAALTREPAPDLIICDFALPDFDGLRALELVRQQAQEIPFIFLSGSIGEESAIAAVRAGAYDYVFKDNMARLPMTIRHALDDFAQRRRRKEDECRLQELMGIVERAGEAIVVSDMTGHITMWNDGAARLYGMGAAEAVGRPAEEILSYTDSTRASAPCDATFETGEWQQEVAITTRDGRHLLIDLRMTLVRDDAGRPSARLSIATDITEKKKLEEQFLRSQRLESLGLLAAGIAHDLNNVLAPVLMASPLLRQRATADEDIRTLDILEKSAQRGAALVRQILGFAHGAGGGLRVVQIKHLLRDVGDVVQASFPKSIALEQWAPSNLWPVKANATQIHQILLNLVVNARDAMLPKGGTLRLRAENRVLTEADAGRIEGARPGGFVVMEVSDTGTGMTPELLARIWEPFFTTKAEGKGTGLGLATVRGIAIAHGGFASVETQVGRGTIFRVFLPGESPTQREFEATDRPALPRGNGELVLVVDDEPSICHVAAAILIRHGYRAFTCRDGAEAIAIFTERAAEIEVVLSDINMPNLDGASLAIVLRRLRPDVKIIALTGMSSDNVSPPTGSEHFALTVSKPFTVEILLGCLDRVLHSRNGSHAVGTLTETQS